jgi:GLPGLI family protein
MKRLFLPAVLFMLVFGTDALAQDGGRIIYDHVVKIDIQLPPEMESMRDQIPKERSTKRMLLFTETESLMRDAPEDENAEEPASRTMRSGQGMVEIRMAGRGPNAVERMLLTSMDSGETVEQRDFMGRTFLVQGEQPAVPWRLTAEQGEYKGFLTHKAVATMDSTDIVAWFTPEIPVSVGPDGYGGLPGAILLLDLNGGKTTYTANVIEPETTFAEGEFERPDKGRKVSKEEFDEIVAEKMKEMQAQGRGGNRVMFRMH